MKTALTGIFLPNQWQAIANMNDIQYLKLDNDHNGQIKVVSIIKSMQIYPIVCVC